MYLSKGFLSRRVRPQVYAKSSLFGQHRLRSPVFKCLFLFGRFKSSTTSLMTRHSRTSRLLVHRTAPPFSLFCLPDTGIHGFPGDLVWDNSKPPSHPRDGHMVYCTHNTITFPTWHRPYMLLFEVCVGVLLSAIVGLTPSSKQYISAWAMLSKTT